MLIVGEKINTSRKDIYQAVEGRDRQYIQDIALSQMKAGASMLDVNASNRIGQESADMEWLVKTVQEVGDIPLCIDSPNPEAIEVGLRFHKGKALVNSVIAERGRLDGILPLIRKYNCAVVGLTMDEEGIPKTAESRYRIADEIIKAIDNFGIPRDDLYLDPLVCPISTEGKHGVVVLEAIRLIKSLSKGVKIILGLSNVSFGLPNRSLINLTFLAMAMAMGVNAAILDPLDKRLMATLKAAKALLGKDEYCLEYLTAYRKGDLDF